MSAALKWNLISFEDYLAGELDSTIKHEYLNGVVHALAGARNLHNDIKDNIHLAVGMGLRGRRCRVHSSDTKIRIRFKNEIRFYYPDNSVVCDANAPTDSYQDKPVVIFEVLSRSTNRTDQGEKKDAYLTIPSLRVYVLVEQEEPVVIVFRRKRGKFVREVYEGLEAVIALPEIEIELPLQEIYESVEFSPEPEEEKTR
jgi:Uma2 family endonuclease